MAHAELIARDDRMIHPDDSGKATGTGRYTEDLRNMQIVAAREDFFIIAREGFLCGKVLCKYVLGARQKYGNIHFRAR